MGWIITGIAEVILEVVYSLIAWCLGLFNGFSIDVGNGGNGLFDTIFPSATLFKPLFITCGVFLVLALMMFKYFQGILGPFAEGENPLKVTGKGIMASICVFASYEIFLMIEKTMDKLFQLFYGPYSKTLTSMGELKSWFKEISLGDRFIEDFADKNILGDLAFIILLLVMFLALLYSLFIFTAEIFMRYVVLGALFYTCPLAFACITTDTTKPIFSNWCRMVASQFLLMLVNLFIIGVFTGSLINLFNNTKNNGYVFENDVKFIQTMFCLIGWLIFGTRADQYLASLGMSVAQTGTTLAASIGTSYATLKGIAGATRTAYRGAKGAYNLGKSAAGKAGMILAGTTSAANSSMNVVQSAERINGKLTEKGAKDILNSKGTSINGQEAKDATKAVGIDTDSFKTAKKDNTLGDSNKFGNVDWNQSTYGDGKITLRDANGAVLGEFGKADEFTTPDGSAMKQVESKAGYMSYAATGDIVSKDTKDMVQDLDKNDKYSKEGITWNDNGNGTITGYDKSGNARYQACTDYMATCDPSKGETSHGFLKDGTSYTVQNISNSPTGGGWHNVNQVAKTPNIIRSEQKSTTHTSTSEKTTSTFKSNGYDKFKKSSSKDRNKKDKKGRSRRQE